VWTFILPKEDASAPDKTFTPCIACIGDWIEKMGFGMTSDTDDAPVKVVK
jgi:hypothetical protein